jgi:translocator protein
VGSKSRSALALVIAIALPLLAGGIGAYFTSQSVTTWYREIEKPSWTPPSSLFGPVWTFLFVLMGVASWLVWRRGESDPGARAALIPYGGQLGLNLLWSLLFFGLRAPGVALIEIVALWGLIALTLQRFYRVKPVAGLLLVPYLLWTTFATALNGAIWWLNR